MSDPTAARLQRLDSCAFSDALDQLGMTGAVAGLAPCTVRRRIVGKVITVRLAAGTPAISETPRHLCTTAIEAAAPGQILVVEQRTGIDAAGWGGVLSNAALARGLTGVIVDGPARDIDEATDLGFPVYARGRTARTARGRIHEAETGGTVVIGDTAVQSGDWAVADSSGVVFIEARSIEKVLQAAERIALREALMTKAVLSGDPVTKVMGRSYETMLSGAAVEPACGPDQDGGR
jgi:4-hydroxy-4-methyl-2-oxoglutarate aldolase